MAGVVGEHLSETGDNLPRVAQYLYENHRPIFRTILRRMQKRVPISGVEPELTQLYYVVAYTSRDESIRLISARKANERELRLHHETLST